MSERMTRVRHRRRARTGLVLGVLAVAVASACGVTADEHPRRIAAERLPAELAAAPSTSAVPEVPGRQSVRVYFIAEDRLQIVHREVAERSPRALLTALIVGPIPGAAPEVRTSIPSDVGPVGAELHPDGVIVVELTEQITSIEGSRQKEAFAQMVYTLTELRGVSAVRFRVGEVDLEVPTDAGSTLGPVRRRDFASLAPAVDPSVTTTTMEAP